MISVVKLSDGLYAIEGADRGRPGPAFWGPVGLLTDGWTHVGRAYTWRKPRGAEREARKLRKLQYQADADGKRRVEERYEP